jgi:hypothetical protein
MGRSIHSHDPPSDTFAVVVNVIESSRGQVVDTERKNCLRVEAKRQRDGGADGAAVRDRHDVAAGMCGRYTDHRRHDAGDHIGKTLALRRSLEGR